MSRVCCLLAAVLVPNLLALPTGAAPPAAKYPELTKQIDAIIDGPDYRHAAWGILVVNVTGAFLIGLAVEELEPRFEAGWVRPAVITGFLGAYTTFSTLSLDTYRLLERGELGQALANVLGTVVLGMLAVWAGIAVGRL